jgi:hypothetical protein
LVVEVFPFVPEMSTVIVFWERDLSADGDSLNKTIPAIFSPDRPSNIRDRRPVKAATVIQTFSEDCFMGHILTH